VLKVELQSKLHTGDFSSSSGTLYFCFIRYFSKEQSREKIFKKHLIATANCHQSWIVVVPLPAAVLFGIHGDCNEAKYDFPPISKTRRLSA